MPSPNLKSWQRSAQQLIQQDPRKAGVLGALLLVLSFMVVRQVIWVTQSASTASASQSLQALTGKIDPATGKAEPSQAGPLAAARWLEKPALPMSRNLFAIKYELFAPEATKSDLAVVGRGFWDEIAKSLTDQVDQQGRKQERLQHLQAQASDLQVTSIMMGPAPRAVINETLVGVGDVVADFRVLKIEARRIIVGREGTRLEIQMK